MPPKKKTAAAKKKELEKEEVESLSEEEEEQEEEEEKNPRQVGSKRGRKPADATTKSAKSRKTDSKKTPSGRKSKKAATTEEDEGEEGEEEEEVKEGEFPSFNKWIDEVGEGWREALSETLEGSKMKEIYNFVKTDYKSNLCFPPRHQIFNVFITSPVEIIKVVVVGQDPYFRVNQAMGLCFSVNKGIKVPPSLKNIYKAIEQDSGVTGFKAPKHGDLTEWAEQGVFLINALLTVREGKPESHKKAGWHAFTDKVIETISDQCPNVVFMLWGAFAQSKEKLIDGKKHLVLKACHPSPMSATSGGFFKCEHFSKANTYLKKHGKDTIDWKLSA
eukprot:CAMPEP_0115044694 /NCGR_PEP_ID=MMETSP0216-20121206/47674_1 /TAXON_ID=223996 /ORGANISM="Protocruzia adherens, Strain Boccale" /LENGTH=331 /DNA_ID=CAMNT_0002427369 /DNA_START=118 /DNA_END=1113 /DNA_ORIENTATION=+